MELTCNLNTEPFLRQIFNLGFTHIEKGIGKYILYNKISGSRKEILENELFRVIAKCKVLGSNEYKWISDGDGSSEIFNDFILNSPS